MDIIMEEPKKRKFYVCIEQTWLTQLDGLEEKTIREKVVEGISAQDVADRLLKALNKPDATYHKYAITEIYELIKTDYRGSKCVEIH